MCAPVHSISDRPHRTEATTNREFVAEEGLGAVDAADRVVAAFEIVLLDLVLLERLVAAARTRTSTNMSCVLALERAAQASRARVNTLTSRCADVPITCEGHHLWR
jgi:hypothetical protein